MLVVVFHCSDPPTFDCEAHNTIIVVAAPTALFPPVTFIAIAGEGIVAHRLAGKPVACVPDVAMLPCSQHSVATRHLGQHGSGGHRMVSIRNAVVNAQSLLVSSRLDGVLGALRGTSTIMSCKDGTRSVE